MQSLSSVSLTFTARHLDPVLDEGWHEHEWTVTAWRKSDPWTDGRSARGALDTLLRSLAPVAADGVRELPPELWSNEALARAVMVLANVVRVQVDREGFGAVLGE